VILGFLLLAIASADYFTRHFAISTDSKQLLSSSLPWRQQEAMMYTQFPQRIFQPALLATQSKRPGQFKRKLPGTDANK